MMRRHIVLIMEKIDSNADERLAAEAKLEAYRDLAMDEERLKAIRASSRLAVEHGLL
jgi:hypothetical protein